MSQPGSLSNLDAAIDIETDCTFKCVSSTVNPKKKKKTVLPADQKKHGRDWIQAGLCVSYESSDHPQQGWMLQLSQQK